MKKERYLTQRDASLLTRLVAQSHHMAAHTHNSVNKLIELFASCRLLPENAADNDCVTLYANVTCLPTNTDDTLSFTLVLPQDANEKVGRFSILTPLGLSLIGRAKHSLVELAFPFDSRHVVKIVDIDTSQASLLPA